jgi:hypothetical protein
LKKFKLTANVNSSKLSEFVKSIKAWEETNAAPTAFAHETPPQSPNEAFQTRKSSRAVSPRSRMRDRRPREGHPIGPNRVR